MKHYNAVISYITLFWKSKLEHDGEKIDYYRKEMSNIIDKMNIDELLELLSIIDVFYINRQ